MTSKCQRYDDFLEHRSTASEAEREAWRTHFDQCVVCSEQAEVDALLRAALTDPPSISFPSDLRTRLPARRRPRRSPVRTPFGARLILASYGLAAVIASVWILSHIVWPSRLSPGIAGLAVVFLVAASPWLVLRRGRISMPLGPG